MERKIGEIFEFEGKTYEVVKDFTFSCRDCDFQKFCSPTKHISQEFQAPVECANTKRSDKENVIFKEIKKDMEIKDNKLIINIPEGMEVDTENSDLKNGFIKFKKKNITYEDIDSVFTISDLLHVLVDYVDDGMGYLEVYFNDKPIKKASLRTINPQMTGTFEPYQEFVLSDKGGKE